MEATDLHLGHIYDHVFIQLAPSDTEIYNLSSSAADPPVTRGYNSL